MTQERFRHEALMYASPSDFIGATVPFIVQGLRAGEPVLVVESREKIEMLSSALGVDDARLVMFADMATVGANPARIIPAWRAFVDTHAAGGKRLLGIGEPIWSGRTEDELAECQRHESLLNVAFAGGQAWHLLCPYDTRTLDRSVIDEARRSHEFVNEGGKSSPSGEYRGLDGSATAFGGPLRDPPSSAREVCFDGDGLLKVRGEVMRFATGAGLGTATATELVTAVNEVATNSIVHGGGEGTLRLWRAGDTLVAEVRDSGAYRHALAGRVRPAGTRDRRGLWLANQLCDLVQVRSQPEATVVRLHMKVHR